MISSGVNVIANLIFTSRYGATSAGIITVITEAVLAGQYIWLLRDQLRRMRWQALYRTAIAVCLMTSVVYLVREWPVWLVIGSGGIIYGGLLVGLRAIGAEELSFVRNLLTTQR
jgi:O-antigen/teichoic acid export membrane protein